MYVLTAARDTNDFKDQFAHISQSASLPPYDDRMATTKRRVKKKKKIVFEGDEDDAIREASSSEEEIDDNASGNTSSSCSDSEDEEDALRLADAIARSLAEMKIEASSFDTKCISDGLDSRNLIFGAIPA